MMNKNIEDYQISEAIGKILVQGILKGYKDYAQERLAKQNEMVVSSGYLWTRSNHIDDGIAKEIQSENYEQKIGFQIGRAGYIWDYVQFLHNNGEKSMIVVKPGQFRPEKFGDATDKKHLTQKSMRQLMSINAKHFQDDEQEYSSHDLQQLQLFDDSVPAKVLPSESEKNKILSKKTNNVDRFYILTYTLGSDSLINSIKLVMPNPKNNTVVMIQDLTDLIGDANLINDDEAQVLKNELAEQVSAPEYFFDVLEDKPQEKQG
ncbi:hypothetical protein EFT43_03965 [Leuconostoc falkenbergense]|uniref:spr1630 family ClpXP-sensitive toxin n=1 Tax=Leuconostoc falkenbergense TaxID=2766470 RepID=UPI001663CD22|nr:hypothetical protein [Leuconostoc falkenbergense]MCT4404085.1 hypothetical protein [Leuconostoc falkenbergense]